MKKPISTKFELTRKMMVSNQFIINLDVAPELSDSYVVALLNTSEDKEDSFRILPKHSSSLSFRIPEFDNSLDDFFVVGKKYRLILEECDDDTT